MRYDTAEYPGVKVTRLDERRVQVENDSNRAFRVDTMAGARVISPGASKVFEIPGETFAMGWDDTITLDKIDEIKARGPEAVLGPPDLVLNPAAAWPFPDHNRGLNAGGQPHEAADAARQVREGDSARLTDEEIQAMQGAGVSAYEINKIRGPKLDDVLEAAERMRLDDGDALAREVLGDPEGDA